MCHQGVPVTLVTLRAVKTANFIFTKNQSEKNGLIALAVGNLVIVCRLSLIFMFDKNNVY